jgi:outer membrane protein
MRSTLRATTIALVLSVVGSVAQAQGGAAPTKIAFINSQALMEVAPGRVQAESLLAKTGQGFRATLEKLQDSAQTMLTNYQKEEPKLTATQKENRQKAIRAIEDTLQAKQQAFQQQFNARQAELMAPITDLVKKVIDDIRVEDGYAMILDNAPGASVIVSADKNLDITDRVVSRLKATPAAKIKVQETAPATKGAPPAPAGVTAPRRPPAQ